MPSNRALKRWRKTKEHGNFNSHILIMVIKSVFETRPIKKNLGPDSFISKFYHLKKTL